MWPFLLPVAAVVAAVLFRRSPSGALHRKGLGWVVAAAVLLALGGLVLMGIPGAVVYELSAPWVRLLLGDGYAELGDGAWPAAIVITLTWPASLVIAYVVARGPLGRRGRGVRWAALVLIPCAFGILLALWAHLSARG